MNLLINYCYPPFWHITSLGPPPQQFLLYNTHNSTHTHIDTQSYTQSQSNTQSHTLSHKVTHKHSVTHTHIVTPVLGNDEATGRLGDVASSRFNLFMFKFNMI